MYKTALFGMTAALAYVLYKGNSTALETVCNMLVDTADEAERIASTNIRNRNMLLKQF